MTLKELLDKFDDDRIIDRLVKLYPDQKKWGYYHALNILRNKKKRKTDMVLSLRYDKKDRYTLVSGVREGKCYALELTSWSQWLSMEIDKKTLRNYKKVNILAHCLWEMTFSGFDEKDIRNKKRMLKRRLKQVDSLIEKEKK